MYDVVCVNGEFLPREKALVPAADRGFLYGFGLFETILVLEGRPVLLARHLGRLAASCRALGLPLAWTEAELDALVGGTIQRGTVGDGALRLTWTAGAVGAGGSLVITTRPPPYGPAHYRRGFSAAVAETRRNETSALAGHKTLNYLENLLAREKARQEGRDEVIFLNTAGGLAETSAGNIFLVCGDRLVTPDRGQGLLPGIVRGLVLEVAGRAGLAAEERPVRPAELARADEVFLTNSLWGVMPLTEAGGQRVGGGRDATRRLGRLVAQAFREPGT